ncbi:MAG: hypothetical protein V1798_00165 [Pseudomonadota bacterium]
MIWKVLFISFLAIVAGFIWVAHAEEAPPQIPGHVTVSTYSKNAPSFVKIEGEAARAMRATKGPGLSETTDCYQTDRNVCQFSFDRFGVVFARKPPLGAPVQNATGQVMFEMEEGIAVVTIKGIPASLIFSSMQRVPIALTTMWQARPGKNLYCATLRSEPAGDLSFCKAKLEKGGFIPFSE